MIISPAFSFINKAKDFFFEILRIAFKDLHQIIKIEFIYFLLNENISFIQINYLLDKIPHYLYTNLT